MHLKKNTCGKNYFTPKYKRVLYEIFMQNQDRHANRRIDETDKARAWVSGRTEGTRQKQERSGIGYSEGWVSGKTEETKAGDRELNAHVNTNRIRQVLHKQKTLGSGDAWFVWVPWTTGGPMNHGQSSMYICVCVHVDLSSLPTDW